MTAHKNTTGLFGPTICGIQGVGKRNKASHGGVKCDLCGRRNVLGFIIRFQFGSRCEHYLYVCDTCLQWARDPALIKANQEYSREYIEREWRMIEITLKQYEVDRRSKK